VGISSELLIIKKKEEAEAIFHSHFYLEEQRLGLKNDKEPVPPAKKPRTMFDRIRAPRATSSKNSECQEYLSEELAEVVASPLEYWKNKAKKWPVISSMAKYYLAIPASSAGVERVFSIAGALGRARRARLVGKNMGCMIMLREYRKPQLLKRLQENYGVKLLGNRRKRKRV